METGEKKDDDEEEDDDDEERNSKAPNVGIVEAAPVVIKSDGSFLEMMKKLAGQTDNAR